MASLRYQTWHKEAFSGKRSAPSDVGVLLATNSVFGDPRLVVAEVSARPALAGRVNRDSLF